jgi:hypothetical protein
MAWLILIFILIVASIVAAFKIPNESINWYKRKNNVP